MFDRSSQKWLLQRNCMILSCLAVLWGPHFPRFGAKTTLDLSRQAEKRKLSVTCYHSLTKWCCMSISVICRLTGKQLCRMVTYSVTLLWCACAINVSHCLADCWSFYVGKTLNQSIFVTSNGMKLQSKRFNQAAAWLPFVYHHVAKIIKEDSPSSTQDKYQHKLLVKRAITSKIHVKSNNYDRADMLEEKNHVTKAFVVLLSMCTFKSLIQEVTGNDISNFLTLWLFIKVILLNALRSIKYFSEASWVMTVNCDH